MGSEEPLAFWASSCFSKLTNPKPFERPLLSIITLTLNVFPAVGEESPVQGVSTKGLCWGATRRDQPSEETGEPWQHGGAQQDRQQNPHEAGTAGCEVW